MSSSWVSYALQSFPPQEIAISSEESIPPAPYSVGPKSIEDILATQLDIIYALAVAGVDPAALDDHGDSASYRACKQMEMTFLQGAFLLGLFCSPVNFVSCV